MDHVVEGAVEDGEYPVAEAGHGLGPSGELHNLVLGLATDALVVVLDQQVVDVKGQGREVSLEGAEVEVVQVETDGVQPVADVIEEGLGLVSLGEASGGGCALLELLTKGEARHELPEGVVRV